MSGLIQLLSTGVVVWAMALETPLTKARAAMAAVTRYLIREVMAFTPGR
jgi:hypothetical protein